MRRFIRGDNMDITQIHNMLVANKWLFAGVVFVTFFLLAEVIYYILRYIFLKVASHTKTEIDDLIIKRTSKPFFFLIIFIGLRLAVLPLASEIETELHNIVGHIIYSFIIFVFTFIIIRIIIVFIQRWGQKWADRKETRVDLQLVKLLSQFTTIILGSIGVMFILQSWGVEIGPLLASLGIVGIAVAFALQQTLSNVFGGISLIADKVVRVGDHIKLDESTEGIILEIGLRSTRIQTYDNDIVIVPNSRLADSKIQNYITTDKKSRVVLPFTVAADTDIDKVKKIAERIPMRVDGFVAEPAPFVIFHEMSDFGLKFRLYFWVESYDKKFLGKDEANTKLYKELIKAKIEVHPHFSTHKTKW
jgi:MscS family membrane protein